MFPYDTDIKNGCRCPACCKSKSITTFLIKISNNNNETVEYLQDAETPAQAIVKFLNTFSGTKNITNIAISSPRHLE